MPDPFTSDRDLDWTARKSQSGRQRKAAIKEIDRRQSERLEAAEKARKEQQEAAEKARKDQIEAAEKQREINLSNAKAAGVIFEQNPETGKKDRPATHDDGGYKFEAKYQGDPYSINGRNVVDWRDDRGNVKPVPLEETPEGEFWNVDKDSGQRVYKQVDPSSGKETKINLGVDPEWQAAKDIEAQGIEYDRKKQEFADRITEIGIRKAELEIENQAAFAEEEEAEAAWRSHHGDKMREKYVQAADGLKSVKTDGTTEVVIGTEETAIAKKWLEDKQTLKDRFEAATAAAKPLHDRDRAIEEELVKARRNKFEAEKQKRAFERDPEGAMRRTQEEKENDAISLSAMGHTLATMRANGEGDEADAYQQIYDDVLSVALDPEISPREKLPMLRGSVDDDGDIEPRVFAATAIGLGDGQTDLRSLADKTGKALAQNGVKTVGKIDFNDEAQRDKAITEMFGIRSELAGKFAASSTEGDKIQIIHEQGWELGHIDKQTGRLVMSFDGRGEIGYEAFSRSQNKGIPIYYQTGPAVSEEEFAGMVEQARALLETPANLEEMQAEQSKYAWDDTKSVPAPQARTWEEIEAGLEKIGIDENSLKQGWRQGRFSLAQVQSLRKLLTGDNPIDAVKELSDAGFEGYLQQNKFARDRFNGSHYEQKRKTIEGYIDYIAAQSSRDAFHNAEYIKQRREALVEKYAPQSTLQKAAGEVEKLSDMVLGSSFGAFASTLALIGEDFIDISPRLRLQLDNTAEATRGFKQGWREDGEDEEIENIIGEVGRWIDSRSSIDAEIPEHLVSRLKDAAEARQSLAPREGVTPDPDTFDINRDPAMIEARDAYARTANPAYLQQLVTLAQQDKIKRELGERTQRWASQSSPVTLSHLEARMEAFNLDPSKAPALLKAIEHSKKGEAQAKEATKRVAKLLGYDERNAASALLVMGADRRTQADGFWGNFYNAGAMDFYETGTEIATTLISGGIAAAAAGATKAAIKGSKWTGGAAGSAVANRMQRFTADLHEIGLYQARLGAPLTRSQKAWNLGITQAKAVPAAFANEFTDEFIQAIKEPGDFEDWFLQGVHGGLGGVLMHGYMTPIAMLQPDAVNAQKFQAARRTAQVKMADFINQQVRSSRPDFEGITPEEVESASALLSEPAMLESMQKIGQLTATREALLQQVATPGTTDLNPILDELATIEGRLATENLSLSEREGMAVEAIIEMRELSAEDRVLFSAAAKVAGGSTSFTDAEAVAIRNNPDWFSGEGLDAPLANKVRGGTFEQKGGGTIGLEGVEEVSGGITLSDTGRAALAQRSSNLGQLLQTEESLRVLTEQQTAEAQQFEQEAQAQAEQQQADQQAQQPAPEPVSQEPQSETVAPPQDRIDAGVQNFKKRMPGMRGAFEFTEKEVGAGSGIEARPGKILINRAMLDEELAGLSEAEAAQRLDAMIDEEGIHVAQFETIDTRYESDKLENETIQEFRLRQGTELWSEFTPEQQQAILQGRGIDPDNRGEVTDFELAMEGIRMILQGREGDTTEQTMFSYKELPAKLLRFLQEHLKVLERMLAGDPDVAISDRIEKEITAVKEVLVANGIGGKGIGAEKSASLDAAVDVTGATVEVTGRPKTVETPRGEKTIETVEVALNWSQLIHSGDPRFPKALQPRDRNTANSKEQVAKIRANPKAARAGSDVATTDDGPPIIAPYRVDGQHVLDDKGKPLYLVVSGNGRTQGIQAAFQDGGSKIERWNKELSEIAASRGLSTEGLTQPALARIYDPGNSKDLIEVARLSNEDSKLKKSKYEQAQDDAEAIDANNLLDLWQPSEAGDIMADSNAKFLNAFIEATGSQNLIQDDGRFDPSMEPRVNDAMLASVVGAEGRPLLKTVMEKADQLGIRNQLKGIAAEAGSIIQIGRDHPVYSIIPELAEAIDTLADFKAQQRSGAVKSTNDYFGQQDVFASSRTKDAEALAIGIIENKSIKAVRGMLTRYRDLTVREAEADMFQGQAQTKAELLKQALRPDFEAAFKAFVAGFGENNTSAQKLGAGLSIIKRLPPEDQDVFRGAVELEADRLDKGIPTVVEYQKSFMPEDLVPGSNVAQRWLGSFSIEEGVRHWTQFQERIGQGASLEQVFADGLDAPSEETLTLYALSARQPDLFLDAPPSGGIYGREEAKKGKLLKEIKSITGTDEKAKKAREKRIEKLTDGDLESSAVEDYLQGELFGASADERKQWSNRARTFASGLSRSPADQQADAVSDSETSQEPGTFLPDLKAIRAQENTKFNGKGQRVINGVTLAPYADWESSQAKIRLYAKQLDQAGLLDRRVFERSQEDEIHEVRKAESRARDILPKKSDSFDVVTFPPKATELLASRDAEFAGKTNYTGLEVTMKRAGELADILQRAIKEESLSPAATRAVNRKIQELQLIAEGKILEAQDWRKSEQFGETSQPGGSQLPESLDRLPRLESETIPTEQVLKMGNFAKSKAQQEGDADYKKRLEEELAVFEQTLASQGTIKDARLLRKAETWKQEIAKLERAEQKKRDWPDISQMSKTKRKEWMAKQDPPQSLVNDPSLYFDVDAADLMIPVADATPQRPSASQQSSVNKAALFMEMSAAGATAVRKPLDAAKIGGEWVILDGNATVEAARRYGITEIPVKIVEATPENLVSKMEAPYPHEIDGAWRSNWKGGVTPGHVVRSRADGRTGTVIRVADDTLFVSFDGQMEAIGVKDVDVELTQAEQDLELKFLPRLEAFHALNDSFQAEVSEVAKKVDGDALHAPVKKAPRAVNKGAVGYGGDVLELQDLMRASIIVDSMEGLPGVIEKIKEHYGDRIKQIKDNFAKPKFGYSDYNLRIEFVDGYVGELQVHIPEIIWAKEAGMLKGTRWEGKIDLPGWAEGVGHKLFEAYRILESQKDNRHQAEMDRLRAETEKVYAAAKAANLARLTSNASSQSSKGTGPRTIADLAKSSPTRIGSSGEPFQSSTPLPAATSASTATKVMPSSSTKNATPSSGQLDLFSSFAMQGNVSATAESATQKTPAKDLIGRVTARVGADDWQGIDAELQAAGEAAIDEAIEAGRPFDDIASLLDSSTFKAALTRAINKADDRNRRESGDDSRRTSGEPSGETGAVRQEREPAGTDQEEVAGIQQSSAGGDRSGLETGSRDDLPAAGSGSTAGGTVPGSTGEQAATTGGPVLRKPRGSVERPAAGDPARNHEVPAGIEVAPAGDKAKVEANIAAIELLRTLEEEGRDATPGEKETLSKFIGWGGFKDAFNDVVAAKVENARKKFEEAPQWIRDNGFDYYLKQQRPELDSWIRNHKPLYERLVKLLTPSEFLRASFSTINAHYTAPAVIDAMWEAVEGMGFDGGTVLEPAMGSGLFYGRMPQKLMDKSVLEGVELDSITARIAAKLYPEARINSMPGGDAAREVPSQGFQDAMIPNNSKDLVISNVPFSEVGVSDPAHDKANLNLHNYFFAKALDKAKPGGLVAFITSSSTLQNNPAQREYLASRGDLVGAIRLPNDAFQGNAKTSVTTDILFFRKRDGEKPFDGAESFTRTEEIGKEEITIKYGRGEKQSWSDWLDSVQKIYGKVYDVDKPKFYAGSGSVKVQAPVMVNEYFVRHPEMVLGQHALTGSMYRSGEYTVESTGDTAEKLEAAIKQLPKDIVTAKPSTAVDLTLSANFSEKEGSFVSRDGKVFEVFQGELREPKWASVKAKVKTFKSYEKIRGMAVDLVRMENDVNADEGKLETLRQRLRDALHIHNKTFENPSKPKRNLKHSHLMSDPEWPLVVSLQSATENADGKTYSYKDADILSKRVVTPVVEPTSADSIQDAINISLAWTGEVTDEKLASLLSTSPEDAREQAIKTGQVFEDPATGLLVQKSKYLSGDVYSKLDQAKAAGADANVSALEAVLPRRERIFDVKSKFGARWIPVEVYDKFFQTKLKSRDLKAHYIEKANHLVAKGFSSDRQYSTGKIGTVDLINTLFGLKKPVVTYTIKNADGSKTRKIDAKLTQEAVEAGERLAQDFQDWVISSNAEIEGVTVADYLEDKWNRMRGANVQPQYDGKHLQFPGLNTNEVYLKDYRVRALDRLLQERHGMIAHGVGTGKTYTLTMLAMELRRLGHAKKPMIAVKNSTLQQFAASFKKAYPGANILIGDENSMKGPKRREFTMRIATGNWDAVIIPHSQLDMIPHDEKVVTGYVNDQIAELKELMVSSENDKQQNNQIQKTIARLEKHLERMLNNLKKHQDNALNWEDLGVDALMVDEIHNYKKIPIVTQKERVRNIPTDFSQKGMALEIKTRDIHRRVGRKANVFGATGTPITNSMAEAYVMKKLLSPEVLERAGITNFDTWATMFGEQQTQVEVTWSGKLNEISRFTKFINGQALADLIGSSMDIALDQEAMGLKLPKIKNGEPQIKVTPQTAIMKEVADWILEIGDAYQKATPEEKKHGSAQAIPIATMNAGTAAALDPRLLDPTLPDDPQSKVNQAIDEIMRIYEEGTERSTTQVVFADRYHTNKLDAIEAFLPDSRFKSVGENDFNLYDDIKQKLIARGVPAEQIGTAEGKNQKQLEKLFDDVDEGKVRIVIGSTERIGEGANFQSRLAAAHHLDPPRGMTPAKLEQRNGRILRQGNLHYKWDAPVEIIYYGTERTMDSAIYQMLATKQGFITQALSGKAGAEFDDPSSEIQADMAMMAAVTIGDPDLIREVELKGELKTLKTSEAAWRGKQARLKRELSDETLLQEALQEDVAALGQIDAAAYGDPFKDGAKRVYRSEGLEINTGAKDAQLSKTLQEWLDNAAEKASKAPGHTFTAPMTVNEAAFEVEVHVAFAGQPIPGRIKIPGTNIVRSFKNAGGLLMSLSQFGQRINEIREETQQKLDQSKEDMATLEQQVSGDFPKQAELDEALAELQQVQDTIRAKKEGSKKADDKGLSALSKRGLRHKPYRPKVGKIVWQPTREGKGDAAITSRNPAVERAAQDYREGRLDYSEYLQTVRDNAPIEAIQEFFAPAEVDRMRRSLGAKADKLDKPIGSGEVVETRLDIPSYTRNNTWIVTVHPRGGGPVLSYRSVARLTNVDFTTNPDYFVKVAANAASKSPKATMRGQWQETTEAEAKSLVQSIADDPNWAQIGMNPFRASWFTNRFTGMPVVSAEEVIQIGGLVYAKKPVEASPLDERFRGKETDKLFASSAMPTTAAGRIYKNLTKKQAKTMLNPREQEALDKAKDELGLVAVATEEVASTPTVDESGQIALFEDYYTLGDPRGKKIDLDGYWDSTHDEIEHAIWQGRDPDTSKSLKEWKYYKDEDKRDLLDLDDAQERINDWSLIAWQDGQKMRNSHKTVLSLFDSSGVFSQPWDDAGYNVYRFDLDPDSPIAWQEDIQDLVAEFMIDHGIENVDVVLAQPPCTDFTCSGNQFWKEKDADGRTEASRNLVQHTLGLIGWLRPKIWAIENPIGRIQKVTGMGAPRLRADPWHFGDPYTKRTQLFGQFNENLPEARTAPTEGSKIHKLRGDNPKEKKLRSLTPDGFAYAFYMANREYESDFYAKMADEIMEENPGLITSGSEVREYFDSYYQGRNEVDDYLENPSLEKIAADIRRKNPQVTFLSGEERIMPVWFGETPQEEFAFDEESLGKTKDSWEPFAARPNTQKAKSTEEAQEALENGHTLLTWVDWDTNDGTTVVIEDAEQLEEVPIEKVYIDRTPPDNESDPRWPVQVSSFKEAQGKWDEGKSLYRFLEMDEELIPISSFDMLMETSVDQIYYDKREVDIQPQATQQELAISALSRKTFATPPEAGTNALQATLAQMTPQFARVFSRIIEGAKIETVAQEEGISESAVQGIVRSGRIRLRANTLAAANEMKVPRVTLPDGRRVYKGGGRPDLSGGAVEPMVMMDQIRNDEGAPSKVTFAEVQTAADQMFKLDPAGARQLVKDYVRHGGMLVGEIPDALQGVIGEAKAEQYLKMLMVAASKRELGRKITAGETNSFEDRMELAGLALGYRELGTEDARALAIRRDANMSPGERHAQHIGEAMFLPDPRTRRRLKKAKNAGEREAIMREWVKRIDGIKQTLKDRQIDVDQILADYRKKQQAMQPLPQHAQEEIKKADPRTKEIIGVLRSGSTWEVAARVTGLSEADVKTRYKAFLAAVHNAGQTAAKKFEEAALSAASAKGDEFFYATSIGLPSLDEIDSRGKAPKRKRKRRKQKKQDKQPEAEEDKVLPYASRFPREEGQLDLNDPLAVKRIMDEFLQARGTAFDVVHEYWKASILSGFQTQAVNIGSGVMFGLTDMTLRKAFEGGLNDSLNFLGLGVKDGPTLSEALHMWKQTKPALQRAARNAVRSWQLEDRVLETEVMGRVTQMGFNGMKADKFAPAMRGKFGKIMRSISFRGMTAADEFIKSFWGTLEAAAQAHRIVAKEQKAGNVKALRTEQLLQEARAANKQLSRQQAESIAQAESAGEAYQGRIDHYLKHGSPAWSAAMDKAHELTFQTQIGSENRTFDRVIDPAAMWLKDIKAGKYGSLAKGSAFFIPFVDTPTNILKSGLRMTPLGLLETISDMSREVAAQAKAPKTKTGERVGAGDIYNQARALKDITNQTFGWMIYFAMSELLKSDEDDEWGRPSITGSMPYKGTKRSERDLAYRVMPPMSIRFGNKIFSYRRLDPFATWFATSIDLLRSIDESENGWDAFSRFVAHTAAGVKEKSYLQGISDIMNAVEDPDYWGSRWAANITSAAVPNLIRQPIRQVDPFIRDSKLPAGMGTLEELFVRTARGIVPQVGPIKTDVWGNPTMRYDGKAIGGPLTDALYRILMPIHTELEAEVNPVDAYIAAWNRINPAEKWAPTAPSRTITVTRNGKTAKIDLTPEEYNTEYANLIGQAAAQVLGDDWDYTNPTAAGIERIDKTLKKARSVYRGVMIKKHQAELLRQWQAQ